MPLKICINGAKGRMGQAVERAAREAAVEVAGRADLGDDLEAALAPADVVIDFSFHTATRPVFETAAKLGKAVVCGTTGHGEAERAQLEKLARQTRVVWAGNFSVGVNLLAHLAATAARILPPSYNAEIVEMHHRLKKDAPSGTAWMLADAVAGPRGGSRRDVRHGREGIVGERPEREIGMHSARGGDVVGDHTLIFADLGERVELVHKASDRAIFARGALRAAAWVVDQPPGLYRMNDVLGLA